jgi:hypothetical protein
VEDVMGRMDGKVKDAGAITGVALPVDAGSCLK